MFDGNGAALAAGGRGRDAAAAFAGAAELTTGTEALFCRQRAAEQLVRSGRFDEGMAALQMVLQAVGIVMPATPAALARSILGLRFHAWLRGYRFHERPPAEVRAEDRLFIEVFHWASEVVRMIDLLPGTWFHYLGMRLSLRIGDPRAVAISLARESSIGLPFRGQSPARIDAFIR